MLKVRTTKTASGKTAVQVVLRENHETHVVKHIGSAGNNEELSKLLKLANQLVFKENNNFSLFPEYLNYDEKHHPVFIENLKIFHAYHHFSYKVLSKMYDRVGFNSLGNQLLKDLVVMRIIEPVSKLKSLVLLDKYFAIKYSSDTIYQKLGELTAFKQKAESVAVEYAKNNLSFDFNLVFYDVTTLYFETFTDDDLRKCGFSKDGKSNQPQILIGLVVNSDGFPIAVNIFAGNEFEGHTIIPTIKKLIENHNIKNLTIVADAAMLSFKNTEEIKKNGLNYIVGARPANLSLKLIKEASKTLNKTEGIYFKTKTDRGLLICDYSEKRAAKDRSDRKKQLARAEEEIKKQKPAKRLRFVKAQSKEKHILNKGLIEKDKLLDGIKGYYTNLETVPENLIVARYKDLWRVEKSFRIAKSDLLARPIFHHKKENIEAHVLIVFISLCISKIIELKTNLSIQKVKETLFDIMDIELTDKLTNNSFSVLMDANPAREILKTLCAKI